MSVLFIVLPVVLVVVLGAVIAYAWAVRRGQFDDLDTPPIRMLHDDDGVTRKTTTPEEDEAPRPAG